jgi:cob(I)alamin adenosyltransferase
MEDRTMTRPRILIFTGEGKGKTTAALGLALRAAGHGMRTCVIQFIKADATSGELAAAARLGTIEIRQTGRGFLPPLGQNGIDVHRAAAEEGLRLAAEAIAAGQFAVVVLDEICYAVSRTLLDEQAVLDVILRAPAEMCLVLTGRGATDGLIAAADTVTEMRCLRHGFEGGVAAQKGVEW